MPRRDRNPTHPLPAPPAIASGLAEHRAPGERALSCAFLISGASGLIFEVVWFHRCGLVFGNTVWATSLVLSAFMGGLAIGSAAVARYTHRIRNFLRAYAVLELVVAVTGVVLTFLIPELSRLLTPITRPFLDVPWLVNLIRLVTAFALLAIPATAMGATLPLLAGAVCRLRPGFGRALGRLYGWNTLGAVAGVIGAETVLVPRFGVVGSGLLAALLNVAAAVLALWVSGLTSLNDIQSSEDTAASKRPLPRVSWRTLVCACLTGAALMALEVVWFRMLSMFVVNSTLAMSLMLAAVLSAIGLGGLAASRWMARSDRAEDYLPTMMFAIACVVIVSYASFRFAVGDSRPSEWYRTLLFSLWLTFPAALLSGLVFTMLGQALRRDVATDVRTAGWLLLANTVGAMSGPLVTAFVLLPVLGMERSLVGMALVYFVAGLLAPSAAHAGGHASATRATWASGAVAALMVLFFPFGLMSGTYFTQAARAYTSDGSEVIASREGPEETIFVTRKSWMGEPVYHRLITNGFSMTATAVPGQRYMRQFVYLPMLLNGERLRRILVICYGVGVTASAATDLPWAQSIDIVEISRDITRMTEMIHPPGDRPLDDPRVRLHLEDGRFFLQNSSERFDLITGEPPPPLTPGTVNIYTREYFRLIHDHLTEGGIATYWLPVGRQEGVDHLSIVRAFCEVFDDCSLWNGTPTDLMLMGTRSARGPLAFASPSAVLTAGSLGRHLAEAGFERPELLGATFLGDAAYLNGLAKDVDPLVDNYPRRLRLAASAQTSGSRGLFDRGGPELDREVLNPVRSRHAFEDSPFIRQFWPDELRAQVLPFFETQRIVSRVLSEGANLLGQIEDVHYLLMKTPLRTLPFWLLGLGNHPVLARVDTMPNDGTGNVEYVRGLKALVARDFPAAAASLAQANARGLPGTRALLAYALCLAGDLETARQVARGSELSNADQRYFWEWLRTNYSVGP